MGGGTSGRKLEGRLTSITGSPRGPGRRKATAEGRAGVAVGYRSPPPCPTTPPNSFTRSTSTLPPTTCQALS